MAAPPAGPRLAMVYNNIMPGILRLEEGRESAVAEACAKALSGGAVAIVPTDTVYGVAASVRVPRAVRRVYAVKGRDAAKPLVVMTASVEEAVALAVPRERESVRRLASFWPGALTVVVEAVELPWREVVAPGSRTLGIRVPDCPFLLEVLSLAGPLAVTSANPSGGEAPGAGEEIDASLLQRVDLVVEGGRTGTGKPSTVAEVGEGRIRVLRRGDISEEDLLAALAGR